MCPCTPSWCHELPKCELHAHLSGSIRDETLADFLRETTEEEVLRQAAPLINTRTGRSLKQCFALFPVIHKLVNTRERVLRVVTEVLEDYENDNCMYLELRTTPRRQGVTFSANEYIHGVLQAISDFHQRLPKPSLVCRVLLSISRDAPIDNARDAVEMARVLLSLPVSHPSHGLVVGLELSGNPSVGKWPEFEPIFSQARREFGARVPISLHFGEILDDTEAGQMLDFAPERVGHAVRMSKATALRLLAMRIPVEVCLTSNKMTLSAPSIAEHPAICVLQPAGHPISLCCDDCGVFTTSLSNEFHIASSQGGLLPQDLITIAKHAINVSFAPSYVKEAMSRKLEKFLNDNTPNLHH
jgi:adenosine deaminase